MRSKINIDVQLYVNKGGGDVSVTQVKKLRQSLNLTQKQVANLAQMSIRGYQRIEAGERIPRVSTAHKIASALNTTVEELFPVSEDAKTAAGDSSSSQNNCIKKKPLPQ